jgi:Chemotaxis phosphatase CheX
MNETISLRLLEVTTDTLEKLAFIFALPAEGPPETAGASLESARVDFSGPFSGAVELSLPTSALAELASNMLGAEDAMAVSPDQQRDALQELVNVVCGNLLPAIAGSAKEFNLRAGRPAPADDTEWDSTVAVGHLVLESGPCRVRMRVDGGLPPDVPISGPEA